VLVTHDRYLLDRVTNAVLGLDGLGNSALFADYLQWEAWRDAQLRAVSAVPAADTPSSTPAGQATTVGPAAQPARKKLSYIEQREYDTIEARINEADAASAPPKSASRLLKWLPILRHSPPPSPSSKRQKPITTRCTGAGLS